MITDSLRIRSSPTLFDMLDSLHPSPDLYTYFDDDGCSLKKVDSQISCTNVTEIPYGCLSQLLSFFDSCTFQVKERRISQFLLPIVKDNIVFEDLSGTHLWLLNVVFNSLCGFVLMSPCRTLLFHIWNTNCPPAKSKVHSLWVHFILKCFHFIVCFLQKL